MKKNVPALFTALFAALLAVCISAAISITSNTHVFADSSDTADTPDTSGTSSASRDCRILFISSYSYAWDTVQIQIEGIKEGISEDVVLDYEFMDTKRFPDAGSIDMFYEGLAYRLERLEPYDAIIVGDDAALLFAMEHKNDIFEGIPIIFEGINDIDYAIEVSKDPLVTGVLEKLSFKKNIDFALSLYPNADTVIAILDNSVTGEAERRTFYNNASQYPKMKFTEINSSVLTTDELINAISSIPENSILIYITMTEDASGRNYNSRQSVRLIAEHSNVPALRMVSGGIGEGLLGGNIVSMELSGKIAAEMADAIAHGKDSGEYHVVTESPNIYCIDEAVMRKFNLSLSLIPKDAEVINHLPSFWDRYSKILIPIFFVLCILIFVIIKMFHHNLKQDVITKELTRRKNKLEEDTYVDFLTGLLNRSRLYSDIETLQNGHAPCAIFIFDIDGFKQINDTYGHAVGDEVLTELGKRISSIKDPAFTPYRLAGDEFVCIYKTHSYDKIDECAKYCISLFQSDFKLKDHTMTVHVSLGVAVCPDDGSDIVKLIERADEAMYQVKNNSKNAYAWYRGSKEKYLTKF